MIEDLHHVQLAIPEGKEDEARDFYGRILGFDEVEKPLELQRRGGVWLERNGIRLHLGVEAAFAPAKKAHPGFRVESLEQAIETLEQAGVKTHRGVDLPDFQRVYIHDPFGNRIELLQTRPA